MNDVLDKALAFVVTRVRFAGENKLDRPLRVLRELHDIFELLENQRRAFVSRETARKTDRQGINAQQLIDGNELALAEGQALDEQTTARKFNQLTTQLVTAGPHLFVRNEIRIGHAIPEFLRINL